MIEIKYNNSELFSGIAPLPYVGISEEPIFYQNRWATIDKISLVGQLTGICQDSNLTYLQDNNWNNIQTNLFQNIVVSSNTTSQFSFLNSQKNELIYRLSRSFMGFSIEENGKKVYECPSMKVVGINFEDSNWASLVNFTVELEGYRADLFSGFYGVVEPVNEFSFDRGDDGIVDLTHTCSAQGIKVSQKSSIENARDYVSSVSGWTNQVQPLFNGTPNGSIILKSVEETIDRLNGVFSITERYRYDPNDTSKGLLRYNTSLNSGEDGIVSVSMEGSIEGGKNTSINDLHSRYSGISFYNKANESYTGIYEGSLNLNPISYSFEESPFEKRIDFSIEYNNDPYPNPYLVDSSDININQNGESSISVRGLAKWRGKCLCGNQYGWNQLKNFVSSYDFYAYALRKWRQYGKTTPLNPKPVSKSISERKNNCEIEVSYSFEESSSNVPNGLDYFEYTIQVSPAIPMYSSTPVIPEAQYSIGRLGYDRRAKVTIAGEAKIQECYGKSQGLSIIKSRINNLAGLYVLGSNKILDSASISEGAGENRNIISFSYTWSSRASRSVSLNWDG